MYSIYLRQFYVTLQPEILLMKKLFSTNYTDTAFDLSMFLIRAGFGFLLFYNHGLFKLQHFNEMKNSFSDPIGIGHMPSLLLVVFAEVFCALLVVAGLLTRFATAIILISFAVLVFIAHKNEAIGKKEIEIIFGLGFLAILFCGPGKWSLDKLIGK